MKLIVGLGNPGEKYEDTRHNVGIMVVDKLSEKLQNSQSSKFQESKKLKSQILKIEDIILAKTTTFMNNSGESVSKLVNFYNIKPSDLTIVYDDLDIKLGEYKIQVGKGPKDHNGLNSIYDHLGNSFSNNFWHARVGIDNRKVENRTPGEVYVLQKFSEEEIGILKNVKSKLSEVLQGKIIEAKIQ